MQLMSLMGSCVVIFLFRFSPLLVGPRERTVETEAPNEQPQMFNTFFLFSPIT
jgi:hypothetical protein